LYKIPTVATAISNLFISTSIAFFLRTVEKVQAVYDQISRHGEIYTFCMSLDVSSALLNAIVMNNSCVNFTAQFCERKKKPALAFVYRNIPRLHNAVFFCPNFFEDVAGDDESKADNRRALMLLHEFTHLRSIFGDEDFAKDFAYKAAE
jgi:hypothetical protein